VPARASPGWDARSGSGMNTACAAWSIGRSVRRGAYSFLKAGQYTAFNGIQGRRHGNLHFAGEHTSVNFRAFMEGGLRSGYQCAREIASLDIHPRIRLYALRCAMPN
jgi:monoamine oxidase